MTFSDILNAVPPSSLFLLFLFPSSSLIRPTFFFHFHHQITCIPLFPSLLLPQPKFNLGPGPFWHFWFLQLVLDMYSYLNIWSQGTEMRDLTFVFLDLDYLTRYDLSQLDPVTWKFHDLIFIHSWIIFCSVYAPHVHYAFVTWKTFRLFPFLRYCYLGGNKHDWADSFME